MILLGCRTGSLGGYGDDVVLVTVSNGMVHCGEEVVPLSQQWNDENQTLGFALSQALERVHHMDELQTTIELAVDGGTTFRELWRTVLALRNVGWFGRVAVRFPGGVRIDVQQGACRAFQKYVWQKGNFYPPCLFLDDAQAYSLRERAGRLEVLDVSSKEENLIPVVRSVLAEHAVSVGGGDSVGMERLGRIAADCLRKGYDTLYIEYVGDSLADSVAEWRAYADDVAKHGRVAELVLVGEGHVLFDQDIYDVLKVPGIPYRSPLSLQNLCDRMRALHKGNRSVDYRIRPEIPDSEREAIYSAIAQCGYAKISEMEDRSAVTRSDCLLVGIDVFEHRDIRIEVSVTNGVLIVDHNRRPSVKLAAGDDEPFVKKEVEGLASDLSDYRKEATEVSIETHGVRDFQTLDRVLGLFTQMGFTTFSLKTSAGNEVGVYFQSRCLGPDVSFGLCRRFALDDESVGLYAVEGGRFECIKGSPSALFGQIELTYPAVVLRCHYETSEARLEQFIAAAEGAGVREIRLCATYGKVQNGVENGSRCPSVKQSSDWDF